MSNKKAVVYSSKEDFINISFIFLSKDNFIIEMLGFRSKYVLAPYRIPTTTETYIEIHRRTELKTEKVTTRVYAEWRVEKSNKTPPVKALEPDILPLFSSKHN